MREKGLSVRRPRARRARSSKPRSTRGISPSHDHSLSIQPQDVSLIRTLETLKPHDHLSLIYESQEEWRAAVVPFIAMGLKRGEKCCYFADAHTAEQLHSYLQAEGVDVASAEASGQLVILCESEAYTKEGSFDPDLMISLLITETEKAVAQGYPALRLTGEMTWVLHGLPGSERLLEYEAKLNRDFYSKYPALGICQYDRWKFDPEVIKGVIMTHPLLVRGNNVYRNFYYIPTDEFLNAKRAELEAQHWLNNVEREHRIQEMLRSSEYEKTTVLAAMSDLVIYQDLEHRVLWVNRAAGESVGLAPEGLIGRYCYEIWHQRSLPCVNCPVAQARETGKPQQNEASSPDGRFWLVRGYPVIGTDGVVSGAIEVTQDITKRKRAEEMLIASEERYRLLADNVKDAIWLMDLELKFLWFSPSSEKLRGYTAEEMKALPLDKHVTPESLQRAMDLFVKAMDDERQGNLDPNRSYAGEFEFFRKDGSTFWADCKMSFMRNEKGEATSMLFEGWDISERKRAEEALRQSEERYRTILEETEEGYYEIDLAGTFTFVNSTGSRLLGYSPKKMIGMNYRSIFSEQEQQNLFKAFNKVYRMGQPIRNLLFEAVRKGASNRVGELSVFPLRNENGDIVGFRGIGRDITERKRAEEILRSSEERFRLLYERAPLAYQSLDADGCFITVNQVWINTMGYSREEVIGRWFGDFFAPHEVEAFKKRFTEFKARGEVQAEVEIVKKDGSHAIMVINGTIGYDEQGHFKQTHCILTDITERKRAEEEMRQLEQKAQIASRLASVGEMSAGVAHEINNPLTGVIGYAQLLLDREDIPSDIRSDLAAINECAQRVAGIVHRLLAFSRQTKPERKLVDINELIESTLVLRVYHLTANNIKVTTRLALDLPEIVADPGQLQQVFLNLIVNAETEMKLAHDKGRLTITTEKSDNTIKICFKDNGLGIKPELMNRIFDPFFTTREVGQGTGLGLSLCYGIVAEHKGKIYAESKPGKGATFVVELPVVTEAEQPKPAEPVVEQPEKVAKARILVVDDEQVVRDVVNRVLTGEGHKVETVDNAADALKKIESKRYNLILMDIKMTGMDGPELYKRIQKIAKSLARRVVFITGDVMGADTEKFLSETKVAHIEKPFDAERLSREVQRALTAGR